MELCNLVKNEENLACLVSYEHRLAFTWLEQTRKDFIFNRALLYICNERSYYQPMTKEQFFEDRPWLEQKDQICDNYLDERIRDTNKIIRERKDELLKRSFEEKMQMLFEKKTN